MESVDTLSLRNKILWPDGAPPDEEQELEIQKSDDCLRDNVFTMPLFLRITTFNDASAVEMISKKYASLNYVRKKGSRH